MAKRNPKNKLEKWEAEIIKAMLADPQFYNQKILAYFTRPDRSINQARIVDIKKGRIHKNAKQASAEELAKFLANWPMIEPATGLHLTADELLVKSREAMLHAVQAYNTPRTFFRSEVFIVTAIIAWTYLLHAHYNRKGIDYRHYVVTKEKKKVPALTKHGGQKYWELSQCLAEAQCPLDEPTVANLSFLIEIRNEIEHQMTNRIDDALSAKLQACCLNFNRELKRLFGSALGLDREFSLALQFSALEFDHVQAVHKAQNLSQNLLAAVNAIEAQLPDNQKNDPRYAFRVALVQKSVSSAGTADEVIEFVKPGSVESDNINRILLKETEKPKLKPAQIVQLIRGEGYPKFSIHDHTQLWKALDAKNPNKHYGTTLSDGQWYWYETWLERVREECRRRKGDLK